MEVYISFISTNHSFFFEETSVNCLVIKKKLSEIEDVPYEKLRLHCDGSVLKDSDNITDKVTILRASFQNALLGGKGGFGAMLRRKAKEAGPKKTTDFGSCRDLSGRRIRHVNDEIILKKWQEAKDRGQEFDPDEQTPSGIKMWFLPTPSWTEGFKGKVKNSRKKAMRKTALCSDWLEAHAPGKRVPKKAPTWWGCPRGNRCDWAHGEDELEKNAKMTFQENKKQEISNQERDKMNMYLNANYNNPNDKEELEHIVMSGLSKAGFKRPRTISTNDKSSSSALSASGLNATEPNSETKSDNDSDDDYNSSDENDDVEEEPTSNNQLIESQSDCKWLHIVSGDCAVMEDGTVLGQHEFSTVKITGFVINSGKWYYEVELMTDGLMQIGWACTGFDVNAKEGDGVGDDIFSWSYDGFRCKLWHIQDIDYGPAGGVWQKGDVIGCYITFDNTNNSQTHGSMLFYKNGVSIGEPFRFSTNESNSSSNSTPQNTFFFPAFSVDSFQQILVNIGQIPYKYQPAENQTHDNLNEHINSPFTLISKNSSQQNKEDMVDESNFKPLDLESDIYNDSKVLEDLGNQYLKFELKRRGLKFGGTLEEKAKRLFSVRGVEDKDIPLKLKHTSK